MVPPSDADKLSSAAKRPQPARTEDDAQRFEVELEFVQCLASPGYLNCTSANSHSVRNVKSLCRDTKARLVVVPFQKLRVRVQNRCPIRYLPVCTCPLIRTLP